MSTGTLQSQAFTASGTFNVPDGVSLVLVTATGAGAGGGDMIVTTNLGSPGGGAGEFCQRVPLSVTAGGTLSVTIGLKGASVTAGGDTVVGSLTLRGAPASTRQNASPNSKGGGYGGASTVAGNAGTSGTFEGGGFTGGSCGGAGGASVNGFRGGPAINQLTGAANGVVAAGWGGGGGGASSPWGVGGAGGNGQQNGADAPATSYGAGGGGAGAGAVKAGGSGCDGYALIQWIGA